MIDRNPDRESTFFVVLNREEPDSILLPAPFHDQWLKAVTPSEGKEYMRDGVIERIYSKNDSTTSEVIATRLWVGDYAAREDGKFLTLRIWQKDPAARVKRVFAGWASFGLMWTGWELSLWQAFRRHMGLFPVMLPCHAACPCFSPVSFPYLQKRTAKGAAAFLSIP